MCRTGGAAVSTPRKPTRSLPAVIDLDAASVFLQWATGGLLFLWVTTRRREVGLGYGWLMRGTYGLFALAAAWIGFTYLETVPVREASSIGVVLATGVALAVSIVRKDAGVAGQRGEEQRRSARVAEMTGIDRTRRPSTRRPPSSPRSSTWSPR